MVIENKKIQNIARTVLSEIGSYISATSTEDEIVNRCIQLMHRYGLFKTWYYDCPALVLLGSNSCKSISGKYYTPDKKEEVGSKNLITIDLSPMKEGACGDCARSFIFERNQINPKNCSVEFKIGMKFITGLHNNLQKYATPNMTFEDLYNIFNSEIVNTGFENLDFNRNLGHSITNNLSERDFIEKGNKKKLSDVDMFTFEPHIRSLKNSWGFKLEDIYYFNEDGKLQKL